MMNTKPSLPQTGKRGLLDGDGNGLRDGIHGAAGKEDHTVGETGLWPKQSEWICSHDLLGL